MRSLSPIFPTVSAVLLLTADIFAASFHVSPSPSGTGSGDGSLTLPWDVATAFGQPASVKPGDTIWLHGGIYLVSGGLTSSLTGTKDRPILFRQYPGERATFDVGASSANRIFVNGAYTWYWGFEVTSSAPERWSDSTGSGAYVNRGLGIDAGNGSTAYGLKFINVVIHDAAGGFGFWSAALDGEIHGCIIYYNGWDAPDRGHAHAIYAQNRTTIKHLSDNIMFGQFSYGIHCYTEGGFIDSFFIEGNISFHNGAVSTISGYTTGILVGGLQTAHFPVLLANMSYYAPALRAGTACNLGYGQGVAGAAVMDNYFASGGTAFNLKDSLASTVTGNTFYGTVTGASAAAFPGNVFYASRPAGARVFVRPNKYEQGRANLCIFNWDTVNSISVDVSSVTGLAQGDAYEVRDAQNYFGPAVATGKLSGTSITVPLNNTAVAPVVGTPAKQFVHTPKEFNAFVLMKAGNAPVVNRRPMDRSGFTPDVKYLRDGVFRVRLPDRTPAAVVAFDCRGRTLAHWKLNGPGICVMPKGYVPQSMIIARILVEGGTYSQPLMIVR